jgi:hypothetical protein
VLPRATRSLVLTVTSAAILLAGWPAAAHTSPAGARERRTPALAPTPADALTRALRTDRITAERYALERARSLFDLGGVRVRFGSVARPDPRSATLLLRDLALRVDRLRGRDRTAALRILARPTDGLIGDPDRYSVAEQPPLCSTHTCVHYVGSTADAPPLADTTGGPEPDHVEAVSAVVEEVWAAEVVGLGYRAPKSDLSSENDGGSALLDVYLLDIGGDGLYGYCTSDDPHLQSSYPHWDMSAYCVLDDDYAVAQFGYADPMDPLRVTAAHELFHAVHFAYDVGEDAWLLESTATWIEDVVYDDIDDNLQYLGASPLAQPLIPLDKSSSPRFYGVWIFWRFLTEYVGGSSPDPSIVRAVWKRADGAANGPNMYSTQALAAAVHARTIDGTAWRLRWAFADFAVWNARPQRFYDEGAQYPKATVAKTATLTKTSPSNVSTAKLDHLTNRFVVVRRGAGLPAGARLRVRVDGPPSGQGPEASLLVIRTSGASFVRSIALDDAGKGSARVVFDTTVSRVVVIVTNASVRYTDCYWDLTPYACFGGRPVDENRVFTFRAAVV